MRSIACQTFLLLLGLTLASTTTHAADGDFVWAHGIGGTDVEFSGDIAVDSLGNVVFTGLFSGTVDFDPGPGEQYLSSAGEADIFVQKLDASGNLVWAQTMGGAESEFGSDIAVDGAGNVYTTGYFEDTVDFDPGPGTLNLTSAGSDDIFVQKLDSSGKLLWARSMGGTLWDGGTAVAVDSAGNVYTTGRFQDTVDFDPDPGTANLSSTGDTDIFVQKLDANGTLGWAWRMGGAISEYSTDISVDGEGNVYTTGEFYGTVDFDPSSDALYLTSGGFGDIFVQKLDDSGSLVWARSMGGTRQDYGHGIAVDGAGNVYTTGGFWGAVDFDPGAVALNLTSAGYWDIFVQKLDANGNIVWARSMGGATGEEGFGIVVDVLGNVYTTGRFEDTVDFDPGPGTLNLSSVGEQDIFVQKLDASGNSVWARTMGGASFDESYGIAVDGAGNVYTTGGFTGTADFDPGPGTANLTSAWDYDMFVLKLSGMGYRYHSADQDGNFHISLMELLRVIQFHNEGGIHCTNNPNDNEDEYLPGPGVNQTCAPHDTDYAPQDWAISLSELLRLIQFYNATSYRYCPLEGTEDGFCIVM